MLNSKETLKKLHKKFPLMSLDELFEILDCYTEESMFTYPYTNPLKTEPYTSTPWTITCKNGISNQTALYRNDEPVTTAHEKLNIESVLDTSKYPKEEWTPKGNLKITY